MTCKDCVHYEACKDMFDGYSCDFDDCNFAPGCIDVGLFKNKADFVEVKQGHWLVNRDSTEARFICSECGFMHIEADPEANIEYNGCPMCLAKLDKRKEGADNGNL